MKERKYNPGCKNCTHSYLLGPLNNKRYRCFKRVGVRFDAIKGINTIPGECCIENENGECLDFVPNLGYRIISLFKGDWCYVTGHKGKPYCGRCRLKTGEISIKYRGQMGDVKE